METKNTAAMVMATFHNDLKIAKQLIYDKCGLELLHPELGTESREYGACTFTLNGKKIQHRISKTTPTKTGQFVTVWKRNRDGITEPFHILDDIDFIIVTSRSGEKLGQFIFPKGVLAVEGVVAAPDNKGGKRGIRIYPPWDIPTNKQATKTQAWQKKYFLMIKDDGSTDLGLARKLFAMDN